MDKPVCVVLTAAFIGLNMAAHAQAEDSQSPATSAAFVQVRGKQLMLGGVRYRVKGANYAGGRYIKSYVKDADGIELVHRYHLFHHFDEQAIDKELAFHRDQLDVNTIRFLTPCRAAFDPFVRYHGWEPWFLADGAINPHYLARLRELLELAGKHGLKVQLVVMHEVPNREWRDGELIPPGSDEEAFYRTYLQSLIPGLRDNASILAYEIANENLVKSPDNYWKKTGYEAKVLSFLKRMADEIRRLDANHLITSGEVITPYVAPYNTAWHWPTPELAVLEDIHDLSGGEPFSLYSAVDYLSPHYYADADSVPVLKEIADRSAKPVVLGEFGFRNPDGSSLDEATLAKRPGYYRAVIAALKKFELSGAQLWDPMPLLPLKPGTYTKRPGDYWKSYPEFVITTPEGTRTLRWYDDTWDLFTYNLQPLPGAMVFREEF